MATLLFHDEYAAMQNCRIKTIHLPQKETARNLGFGRWLVTSASEDFLLTERLTNSTDLINVKHHKGCKVCIITLECGHELEGNNVHIKSDLSTCKKTGARKLNIQLSPPLSRLFSKLPPLPNLPQISDIGQAQEKLLEGFQLHLTKLPTHLRRNEAELDKIADPVVFQMQELKPHLTEKFSIFVNWKTSFAMGFVSFLISQLLHFLFLYLNHRFFRIHVRFPFRLTLHKRKIRTRPVAGVSVEDYAFLQNHPEHEIHSCTIVVPIKDDGIPDFKPEFVKDFSTSVIDTEAMYPTLPPNEQHMTMATNPIYSRIGSA